MGKQLNAVEKEHLIKRYRSNPSVKLSDFCTANNISDGAFKIWLKQYDEGGIEGLYRASKNSRPLVPEGIELSEEYLRRRVIELTIENERLKKNYTVTLKEDGQPDYVPLKVKNSK